MILYGKHLHKYRKTPFVQWEKKTHKEYFNGHIQQLCNSHPPRPSLNGQVPTALWYWVAHTEKISKHFIRYHKVFFCIQALNCLNPMRRNHSDWILSNKNGNSRHLTVDSISISWDSSRTAAMTPQTKLAAANMQGWTSKPSCSGNMGAICFTIKMLESGRQWWTT